jgi:O-antigen/teichoic acid export membrane protein
MKFVLRALFRLSQLFPFTFLSMVLSALLKAVALSWGDKLARVGEVTDDTTALPSRVMLWLDRIAVGLPGSGFDVCLRLPRDDSNASLQDTVSVLLASSRVRSIYFYWDEASLRDDLPLLQARQERREQTLSSMGRDQLGSPTFHQLHDFLKSDHHSIILPVAARRDAQTLLKRYARGSFTVCFNLPAAARSLIDRVAASLPDVRFVDLGVMAPPSGPGSSNVLSIYDHGLNMHERLAIVEAVDAYVGCFDAFGCTALSCDRPSILLGGGQSGDQPSRIDSGDSVVWFTDSTGPVEAADRIVEFLRHRLGKSGHGRSAGYEAFHTTRFKGHGSSDTPIGMFSELANSFWQLLIVGAGGAGLTFMVHLLLARTLGVGSYGLYIYALAWASTLAVISQMGTAPMVLRQVSVYGAFQDWSLLRRLLRFSRLQVGAISIVLTTAATVVTLLLDNRLSLELSRTILIAALLIPALGLLQLHLGLLNGLRRPLVGEAIGNIMQPLILLGLLLVAMGFGMDLDATRAMAITTTAAVLVLGLVVFLLPSRLPPDVQGSTPNDAGRHRPSFSMVLLFMIIANLLLSQSDILMIGALLGTDAAAIYAPPAMIASLILFPIIAVNTVVSPRIAEDFASGRRELMPMLPLSIIVAASVAICIAFVVCFFSWKLLWLFGPAYTAGQTVLIILVVGYLFNLLAGPVDYLLIMTRFARMAAIVLGVSAALNLALNALLIPRFGIEGAAVAKVISVIGWNLGMAAGVWHKLREAAASRYVLP